MSAPMNDVQLQELRKVQWVARMAMPVLIWQFRTHRKHYLGRMGDNPVKYLSTELQSYYSASPRGWQRQFRRAPAKLANCVYHQISCDLGGAPVSSHVRPARVDLGGGIKRSPRPEQNYDQISHEITRNPNLSFTAQGVLIRLLSNADGVSMTADDLLREKEESARSRRGTGRRAVLAALAELRLQGYLQTFIVQGEGGLHLTTSTIFDQPQPPPAGWRPTANGVLHQDCAGAAEAGDDSHERAQVIDKTGVRLPAAGLPAAGKRTPLEITRELPREKSSSTRAGVRRRCCCCGTR